MSATLHFKTSESTILTAPITGGDHENVLESQKIGDEQVQEVFYDQAIKFNELIRVDGDEATRKSLAEQAAKWVVQENLGQITGDNGSIITLQVGGKTVQATLQDVQKAADGMIQSAVVMVSGDTTPQTFTESLVVAYQDHLIQKKEAKTDAEALDAVLSDSVSSIPSPVAHAQDSSPVQQFNPKFEENISSFLHAPKDQLKAALERKPGQSYVVWNPEGGGWSVASLGSGKPGKTGGGLQYTPAVTWSDGEFKVVKGSGKKKDLTDTEKAEIVHRFRGELQRRMETATEPEVLVSLAKIAGVDPTMAKSVLAEYGMTNGRAKLTELALSGKEARGAEITKLESRFSKKLEVLAEEAARKKYGPSAWKDEQTALMNAWKNRTEDPFAEYQAVMGLKNGNPKDEDILGYIDSKTGLIRTIEEGMAKRLVRGAIAARIAEAKGSMPGVSINPAEYDDRIQPMVDEVYRNLPLYSGLDGEKRLQDLLTRKGITIEEMTGPARVAKRERDKVDSKLLGKAENAAEQAQRKLAEPLAKESWGDIKTRGGQTRDSLAKFVQEQTQKPLFSPEFKPIQVYESETHVGFKTPNTGSSSNASSADTSAYNPGDRRKKASGEEDILDTIGDVRRQRGDYDVA